MLLGFLESAKQLLTTSGEIHVTLKTGEPYDSWNVKKLAKTSGLFCKTTLPFDPNMYSGYSHRRTLGYLDGLSAENNEEIKGKECKTYVFSTEFTVLKRRKIEEDDD